MAYQDKYTVILTCSEGVDMVEALLTRDQLEGVLLTRGLFKGHPAVVKSDRDDWAPGLKVYKGWASELVDPNDEWDEMKLHYWDLEEISE